MINRKSNAELKGITLKQSILCLEHEWTGNSLKDKEFYTIETLPQNRIKEIAL